MATTVEQAFETYKAHLEITGLQQEAVSSRQEGVQAALEDELSVLNSFLAGSYARDTMIAPLSQAAVDIVAVLDPSYYEQNEPAELLERVKQVLAKSTAIFARSIWRCWRGISLKVSGFWTIHPRCAISLARAGSSSQKRTLTRPVIMMTWVITSTPVKR